MPVYRKSVVLILCSIALWSTTSTQGTLQAAERSRPSPQRLASKSYAVVMAYADGGAIFVDTWKFRGDGQLIGSRITNGIWSGGGLNWGAEFTVPGYYNGNLWSMGGIPGTAIEGFGLLLAFGIADPAVEMQPVFVFGIRTP